MATPSSASRRPWNTTMKHPTTPCSSSIFLSFHTIKRPRSTTSFSFHDRPHEFTIPKKPIHPHFYFSCSKPPDITRNDVAPKNNTKHLKQRISVCCISKRVRGIMLLNVLTVVSASNIPVVKEVEAVVDPAVFTVVRFVVAALPFIPFVLQAWDDVDTRNAGIELGFWVSLGYLMQAFGLETSDAGRASFLSMFTVIVVPLLDGMLGAIVPARTWFGAFMSIVGVGMLESSGSPPSVGDIFNFLSAVFFGIHLLRTEHISRSTKGRDLLPLLGYELCVVALFSMIWYFLGGCFGVIQGHNLSSWTWAMSWDWMIAFPWIPALYTGIFSTGLCLWIEMTAMRDVYAAETAIIYGLEPVWGAGFAWFFLGERWGATGWIGAALVLGGSLTVQIMGSLSPTESHEDEKRSGKTDKGLLSEKPNAFSTSPLLVPERIFLTWRRSHLTSNFLLSMRKIFRCCIIL
ncbi:EamA domain-containing protein [Cephalotus follicularis]|uniref:EamA domain-containing protein n=1 Tax=Cephalotus follicularis TaxID=3775 RepID=A0A1Q3B545_CEPFO|nr:EamA domain-containing protein [Cephalotus follicularis]